MQRAYFEFGNENAGDYILILHRIAWPATALTNRWRKRCNYCKFFSLRSSNMSSLMYFTGALP